MKDEFYHNYDEEYFKEMVSSFSKKHIIKFVKFLFKSQNIAWLDVGCGMGYLLKEGLEEGVNIYGIDISKYAIENNVVKGRVKYGSITNIPFEDNVFDVVSLFDVVEHIHPKEIKKAISEIRRVLKSGGFLIITTPNPCFENNWVYDLTHINVRPPKYWKKILESYGFYVKIKYIPSFLKYYISEKFSITIPIPDPIAFYLEIPLRYFIGYLYNRKGRLYIVSQKR